MSAEKQLIFYEEDVAAVLEALGPWQQTTRTKANVVLSVQGNAFAQTGDPGMPPETIGALVAASFAATRPVSDVVLKDEIVTLTHEGKRSSVQLTQLGRGAVLATVFDAKTTPAAIMFHMKDLHEKLVAIVKTVSEREPKPVDLGAKFDDAAKGALDDVFGDMGAEAETEKES